ncbi:MAG TPA: N-acetyltransferase [Solirubrobacterales bacterium]|jgi:acetyltransferase-like isoleucine patch superfamily enzyme
MPTLSASDLAPNLLVGAGVTIADEVEIGANVVVHDDVTIEPGARLDHGAVVGKPPLLSRGSRTPAPQGGPTLIGEDATVCAYALVVAGARMEPHSFLGDHAHLREGAVLEVDAAVGSGSGIGREVRIGAGTRMQNHCVVGPGSIVEADCFLGPGVQVLTGRTMGSARRGPPVLRRGCQLGAGAKVLPGVEVGTGAIVGAGAVVVADVPPGAVVRGIPARASE